MSTPVISGDGIFSHIFIGAADLQKSVAFYAAALGALGIKNLGPFNNGWVLFGRQSAPPQAVSFNPTSPASSSTTLSNRAGEALSPKMTMPSATVPSAPIPTHIA